MPIARRILISGHHPDAPSGFARVCRGIGDALEARGHAVTYVDILGRGGAPGTRRVHSIPGTYSTRGQTAFAQALASFRPDLVLTVGDTWDHYYVPDVLGDARLPWVFYVPVEQAPLQPSLDVQVVPALAGHTFDVRALLSRVTHLVAYNHFGASQLRALLPERTINEILHGVDTMLFQRANALPRREELFGSSLNEETFLVTTIARNLERKGLDLLLMAWAQFIATRPEEDARLYLHVPRERGGHDIRAMLELLNCSATVLSDSSLTVEQGASERRLVQIVQSSSVYLNTSRAEGFGLPIVEAMACGVPSIVPDQAGPGCIAALVADSSVVQPVPIAQSRIHAVDSTFWGEVDVKKTAECLAQEHARWKQSSAKERNARAEHIAAAARKHFSWEKIGADWTRFVEPLIEDVTTTSRPSARPTLSIIIPAYENLNEVIRCVETLRATATFAHEYIVQDDCSPNIDLREHVPPALADTRRNARNLGFAANAHAGAQRATGDIFFFVNQDVFADAQGPVGWDERLIERLSDPSVGAVGTLLYFPPDPLADPDERRIQSCGNDFDEHDEPFHPLLGADVRRYPQAFATRDVAWISGIL